MAKVFVKNIKTGPQLRDVISVRPHGSKVRLVDVSTGQIILMTPDVARALGRALPFAAKHAEISRPLAYQLYERLFDERNKTP